MKRHLLFLLAMMAVVTGMNARTVLIDEGFENGIQEEVWTQEFVAGQMPWAIESVDDALAYPSTVVQGTHRAYLRNTTGETMGYVTRLVSKVMDLRPTMVYMPELTFWYANPRWGGDRDTLRVLYRNGTRTPWKQLAEFSTASADWTRVKLELPEVGANYQIAFEGSDNLGRGIVLDSIKLQSAPECTVPADLLVTSKGAGKVNLAWVASWDASYFEVIVSKDTIDPEMVEQIEAETPEKIVFHELIDGMRQNCDINLESGEFYLAYVRSLCDDENSAWSSDAAKRPFGFHVRTAKQVPFTERFEGMSALADPTRLPDWTWASNTGNPNPYVNTKVTNQNTLANYSYDKTHALIFSGGTTTSPSTFIPADRYVYLATPALADTLNDDFAINQCQVHFWATVYTYTGRQYGRSIIVGVMEDPDDITTFVPVDTVSVWGSKTFQENIVDLSSYNGTGVFLALVSDFDRQNLIYIDNLTVDYRPAVNKVTKISVNPRDTYADIRWEGNANSYHVLVTNAEVDPANPDADAVVDQATVSSNSYRCEALEADHSWNRPYYVYVQAAGTEWSYRYPFVTIAPQREIPYTFNMEASTTTGYQIPSDPNTYVTGLGTFGNGGTYPAMVTNANNSYAGSGYLYMNKRGGTDAWVTLPMVDDLSGVQVKLFLSGGTTFNQAHATIGVMSNPMDINTFVPVSHHTLNATGYTRCYANFENYRGPEGVIAIVWDDVMNMTENTINFIDEITVEELSECVPPTNIDLSIFPDSVVVGWESSLLSDEWEFFISRTALTTNQRINKTLPEIASLPGVVIADTLEWHNPSQDPRFGFGGLTPHSSYYIYVRATCDRDWWMEQAFSTPCQDEVFPYKETFESYNAGSTNVGCWQLADYMGVGYPVIYQAGSSSASNKVLHLYSSGTTHRSVAILPRVEGELSSMLLSFDVRLYSQYYSSTGLVVVGTMGDIADQASFVPFDTIEVNSSTFTKVRLVLSNYQLAYDNIAITSGLGTLMTSSDVLIDNVELKDPSCIEAYDFRQTDSNPDSFDMSWKGVSPSNQWEVKVLNTSVSIAAVKNGSYNTNYEVISDTILSGTDLHVGGLEPVHTYYVYVRTLCGDSVWTMVTAKTSCALFDTSKPNKETFEYGIPDCWTGSNNFGSSSSPIVKTHEGSNMVYLEGTSSYSDGVVWVASPKIKCDSLYKVMVTFTAGTYSSDKCVFGVMTDPEDIATLVPLDTVNTSGVIDLRTFTYDLSAYKARIPANAKYIAWSTRSGRFDWIYLDDVSVVSVFCSAPEPYLSNLTTSGVQVYSGLGSSDRWVLLVTNRAINEDNLYDENYVIPDNYVLFRDTVTANVQAITGLEGQSKYYVYAAAICEQDSVLSQWKSIAFMTPCLPLTPEALGTVTFSYEEGFTTGAAGEMPCWTTGSKTAGAYGNYIPFVSDRTDTKHDGYNYLRFQDEVYLSDASKTSYSGAYAIMPALDVNAINKYQVNFWGRGSSNGANKLIVGVVTRTTNMNTFMAVDTVTLDPKNWAPYLVGFENYEGDYMGNMGKNIAFLSDFGSSNEVFISEVSVELIPPCRPNTAFVVDTVDESSATISWKGYQNSYRVMVADKILKDSLKSSYHYLVDTIVTHSSNVRIKGLQPFTRYYIYAQGICGVGDSTDISQGYASVRTACPTETGLPLPFYDDFESYEKGDRSPGCWQFLYTGSATTDFSVREVSDNGTKAIELYPSTYSSRGCWMVVPKVDGNLENLNLSFDARSYYGGSSAKAYVGVMEDVDDVTTFVLLKTFNLAGSSAFTHCSMDLADYELPYDNLVITTGIPNILPDMYDVYVDNVSLTKLASCNAPKVRTVSVSSHTAELLLTPADRTDSQWQIVVIKESDTETLGAAALANLIETAPRITQDSTRVLLTGLEDATSYLIYARTICSEEDQSAWSRTPLRLNTRFYYANSYFFGFEKGEPWQRSMNSGTDRYYLHPALEAGKDSIGAPSDSYIYYPYSLEDAGDNYYARTGTGALMMHARGKYYGGYIIFPAIGEAQDRSFEFKVRPGYLVANGSKKYPTATSDVRLEIGTIEKDKSFDTYEPLATIHLDKLNTNSVATSRNNYHYSAYTLDLTQQQTATRQIVFRLPKQSSDSVYLVIDDVQMGDPKSFSLVSLSKITAEGTKALVEWNNIGGPWNLYIKNEAGTTVASYLNLTGVTSQLVEGLDQQTNYTATLESVVSATGYVTTDKMSFRTLCLPLEPDAEGAFSWSFDDAFEWEPNDILAGDGLDSLYIKPSCFTVGITYDAPVNGYQWLIQRKGYPSYGPLAAYSSTLHREIGRNDSHSLRIHTTDANYNSYIVLPALNCGLDTMMIDFYGRCFANYDKEYTSASYAGRIADATYLGAAYSQSIVVGTLTDPMDFSTLQVLDTLTYSQTELNSLDNVENDPAGLRYWEQMRMPLTGAEGKYIVLFQPAPGLFYLDDLTVKPIGNTLFAPSSTRTSDITGNSATLSWNTRHPQLPTVVVLLNAVGEEISRDTVVATSYSLSGLRPAMVYQWYVYQVEGTEPSPSSKPVSFHTECAPVTEGYTCGFETVEGTEAINGNSAYRQMLCWTYSDAARGGWTSATYDPYNQANTASASYSYMGSSALMMRASYSSRSSYQPYIALPQMDVNAYDTLQLSFWMRPAYVSATTGAVMSAYTGSTYSKSVIVGTMTNPADTATFVPIDTLTYDGTLSTANTATAANDFLFQQMKVELTGATGPYVVIMTSFYEKGGTTRKTNDYLWIDNIAVERINECKEPKELTNVLIGSVHADLAWDGPAVAHSYRLQVSTDLYFEDEKAIVYDSEVKTNSARVEGLEPLTTYVWRVQSVCGEEWGESNFSTKATFTTSRSPYFLEEFNEVVNSTYWISSKAHADNVVDSTGVLTRGSDNWSFVRTANSYGLNGSHYVASGSSNDYHWLVSPNFYLPENDSCHLSMDLALTACNSAHMPTANAVTENDMKDDYYFMIIVSDDGGESWKSANILAKWQNTNPEGMQLRDIPTNGMNVRYSLAAYAGKNIRIGLYREAKTASNTGVAIHVDNLRLAYFQKTVDYTSACQYEDVQVGDIFLSGDDTKPGIHAYPTVYPVTDAEARAGKKDSVFSLEIEVFPTQQTLYADTICEGDTYTDLNFSAKEQPGSYRRKLQTVEYGCDSIVTLHLTVKERRYGEDTEATICKGEEFEWNGKIYNRAGIYRDTMISSIGCDSVETLVISYMSEGGGADTVYVERTVDIADLPYSYADPLHPYAAGQAPIYYPAGTPKGVYTDTVRIQSEFCAAILVHTLTIIDRQEAIDLIGDLESKGARKVIYRENMYIILNDEWYNASGQKVLDPRL